MRYFQRLPCLTCRTLALSLPTNLTQRTSVKPRRCDFATEGSDVGATSKPLEWPWERLPFESVVFSGNAMRPYSILGNSASRLQLGIGGDRSSDVDFPCRWQRTGAKAPIWCWFYIALDGIQTKSLSQTCRLICQLYQPSCMRVMKKNALSWSSNPHEIFWRTRSCSIPCDICPSFLLQDLRPPLQLEVIACTAHHPLILMLILYLKQSLGGRWRQQQNVVPICFNCCSHCPTSVPRTFYQKRNHIEVFAVTGWLEWMVGAA